MIILGKVRPLSRHLIEAHPQVSIIARLELTKDKAGKFRFHLKAANGEIIAASQGYETKAGAEKGIESVKATAPSAQVVDLSG